MKKHNTIVSVEAVTWSRESHGLFDYESRHISKRSLKAASSAKIIRIKNDIRLVTDVYNERNVCENSKMLAMLKHHDGVFTVTRTNSNLSNAKSSGGVDNLWLVVKNMKKDNNNQEYIIKENDILKLGRIKFRVKELNFDDEIYESPKESEKSESNSEEVESNAESNFEDEVPKSHRIKKVNESPELSCRICLNSENFEKNPLISPCGCAGSVKHIHLDCLKHWIKSKTQIKSSGLCVSYTWKSLECELCHQPLPDYFLHNGKRIDLIDLPKPNSSYIILETMAKEKHFGKTFYVVLATENDTIKLGRGNDCDVKINDISASRCHAFIHYSNGKFTLKDNDSKFGTLVLIKNDFVIKPDCTMAVQIGRSVISFSLMTKNNPTTTQETPDLLKAYSAYSLSNEIDENKDDLEKIQSFFLKNKDLNFQNFIDTVEGVQLRMPSTTSCPQLSKKDKAACLNSDLFNLTFAKDKDRYSHVQDLLDRQSKIKTTSSRAKSNEDKVRERKNILNEMQLLNIDNDNDEDEAINENNGESDVEFEDLRQKM